MFEFVSSKVAMAMAGILILASVFGFFQIQNENIARLEFQETADRIADTMNEANSVNFDMTWRVGFSSTDVDVQLKEVIGGERYSIELYPNSVLVVADGRAYHSSFIGEVHLWDPGLLGPGDNDIEALDITNNEMSIASGEDFIIVRRPLVMDHATEYHTFAYFE